MAYSKQEKDKIINSICEKIEKGLSLRNALLVDNTIPRKTFFEWIDNDKEKSNQYARATTTRQELIFDEITEIADTRHNDTYIDSKGNEQVDHEVVQRDRLRIDARKWSLSKMNPKKYGDSSLLKLGNNEGGKLDLSKHTDEELEQKIKEIVGGK